jgi:hypothetical protein
VYKHSSQFCTQIFDARSCVHDASWYWIKACTHTNRLSSRTALIFTHKNWRLRHKHLPFNFMLVPCPIDNFSDSSVLRVVWSLAYRRTAVQTYFYIPIFMMYALHWEWEHRNHKWEILSYFSHNLSSLSGYSRDHNRELFTSALQEHQPAYISHENEIRLRQSNWLKTGLSVRPY